jgi:hypothetical protein
VLSLRATALCLVAGLLTSVAVAWSAATWSPLATPVPVAAPSCWSVSAVPSGLPGAPEWALESASLGFTVSVAGAGEIPRLEIPVLPAPIARERQLVAGLPFPALKGTFATIECADGLFLGSPPSPLYSFGCVPGRPLLGGHGDRALPWRPIWGGLAANTAIYGVVFALCCWLAPWSVRARRVASRRCAECGYPVGSGSRCAECGIQSPERPA